MANQVNDPKSSADIQNTLLNVKNAAKAAKDAKEKKDDKKDSKKGLSASQKKLPKGLQDAILKKKK